MHVYYLRMELTDGTQHHPMFFESFQAGCVDALARAGYGPARSRLDGNVMMTRELDPHVIDQMKTDARGIFGPGSIEVKYKGQTVQC